MDHVSNLISRASNLVYDVNKLMNSVNDNTDLSFITGAEEGQSIDKYNLKDKAHIELFNKRKELFGIFNQIINLIGEMSLEDKKILVEKINLLRDEHLYLYVKSFDKYQEIISKITEPDFSFEGNMDYKRDLIQLKEDFNRHQTAADYLKNLLAYLGSYRRSK